ncbi:hypothetical protein JCM11641_002691, partial [Rhodosporidiobolus odoratus]
SAHIVTAAIFAPTSTRTLLADAGDPIFSDGHTHAAPLALAKTMTGNTTSSSMGERLVPVKTIEGGRVRMTGVAEDAVVVVADDETGIISIFRNSTLPSDPSLLGSTGGYLPTSMPTSGSGFSLNGAAVGLAGAGSAGTGANGLQREGSKRWSRH